jgi:putative phosphoesterase
MKIALLSDTHGYMGKDITDLLASVDEIWHAGDIGPGTVIEELEKVTKVRSVYGNIDSHEIRDKSPLNQFFELEGLKFFMTHIGGYPGRYTARVRNIIRTEKPNVYICGHSHILKVVPDPKHELLHLNPGACGHHGFHKVRTFLRFEISSGEIKNMEVVELGRRGTSNS